MMNEIKSMLKQLLKENQEIKNLLIEFGICISAKHIRTDTDVNGFINLIDNHYHVKVRERNNKVYNAKIRHALVVFLYQNLNLSTTEIGVIFDNRDHSTILHSIRVYNDCIKLIANRNGSNYDHSIVKIYKEIESIFNEFVK